MTERQMKWVGVTRLIALSAFLLCWTTVGLSADVNDSCSSSAILSEMRSYYPVPISASPDGKLILARAKPEGQTDSGLVVIDSHGQKVIRSLKWSDPMIHVLWRPDGKSVSFFSQEPTTNLRHLILWNLNDGTTREVPVPPTFNQPHVLWSPDGSKLAFSQETKATVIVSADGAARPVIYPGKFAIFAWSGDSLQLALLPDDESHQVMLVDSSSFRLVQRITTKVSGKLVDAAWEPRKDMLLLLQHSDGSRYVVDYDIEKSTERILFSWNLDLRSPAWLPLGQGYIFQRLQNGTGDLFVGSEQDGVEPKRLPLDGISDFRGILPDGKTIAVTHRSAGPVEILKVPLDASKPEVLAAANLSALGTVSPEQIFVNLAAGLLQPSHMGVLVIASLPGPPRGWQGFGFIKLGALQVLALHGENDRIVPPIVAQRFIEKALGSDALTPVDKHWYVLKWEDHVLHLDSSWAVVHWLILSQLGLITCDELMIAH